MRLTSLNWSAVPVDCLLCVSSLLQYRYLQEPDLLLSFPKKPSTQHVKKLLYLSYLTLVFQAENVFNIVEVIIKAVAV